MPNKRKVSSASSDNACASSTKATTRLPCW
ncbi:Uncharacterised protein [Vibrio cholerae]|nr:Uncharacterised protein [Vibrio cholerae]